jgi:hypothetical protein
VRLSRGTEPSRSKDKKAATAKDFDKQDPHRNTSRNNLRVIELELGADEFDAEFQACAAFHAVMPSERKSSVGLRCYRQQGVV